MSEPKQDPRCPACGTFMPMAYCWACGEGRDAYRDRVLGNFQPAFLDLLSDIWEHGFETGKEEGKWRAAAAYNVKG